MFAALLMATQISACYLCMLPQTELANTYFSPIIMSQFSNGGSALRH